MRQKFEYTIIYSFRKMSQTSTNFKCGMSSVIFMFYTENVIALYATVNFSRFHFLKKNTCISLNYILVHI